MINYISLYPNVYEEGFNEEFLNATQDIPLVDYVISCMKDFESIENIEILDYYITEDQDDVDLNNHMVNINYKKKDLSSIQIPKYKFIADNYFGEIVFHIKIKTNINEKIIEKRILLPEKIDGYYMNNSRKMRDIWQLVDASIYNQRNKLSMKSRMPIVVYHNKHRITKDIFGTEFVLTSYSYASEPPKKKTGGGGGKKRKTKFINPLAIYSAKMGLMNTIDFFGMKGIVSIATNYKTSDVDTKYIFPLDDLYILVDRELFDKYELVRSYICMLVNVACRDFPVTMENMNDKDYWICRIGYIGSIKNKNLQSFYDKGITTLYMIERLLNTSSINALRVPDYYKQNIYYVLYWIITNYDKLRDRNNIDMKNKRIRKNEYIVDSTLGRKISENINKLIERKSKSRLNTIDTLLELFNFGSDIIVSGMRNLNDLIKSDDLVNDMTFLTDLSYSAKGPNSLGENSSKVISAKYRYLDPSMVGVLDLFATSNSDCGLSGSFTPYVKLYDGFYFTPDHEPAEARYNFECALEKDGIDRGLNLFTFEDYIIYMEENDPYQAMLQNESILIVEREVDESKPF